MKQAILNEWLKIRKQKKAIILMIITFVSALVVSGSNLYFNQRAGFTMIDPDQMPLTIIGLLGAMILPLVAYIMAVDAISNEYRGGTIKYSLMAPISTLKAFGSKLIALTMYNGVLLAGVMVISFTMNIFWMNTNIFVNLGAAILAYTVTLIPLTLVSLWGLMIGSYFSPGLSLAIGIVGHIALNVGQLFVPLLGALSPVGYMNLYNMVVYNNTALLTLLSTLMYVASYYIILVTFNVLNMKQKEI